MKKITIIITMLFVMISSMQVFARVIPTNNTIDGPAAAAFKGKLFVAWTDTENKIRLKSSYNGSTFLDEIITSEQSYYKPSLASVNNRLYLAWTGTDGRLNVCTSTDGVSFSTKTVLEERSIAGPTIVSGFSYGAVYLGWTGTDHRINTIYTNDGLTFNYKTTYDNTYSLYSPGLAYSGNASYIAWTGFDGVVNIRKNNKHNLRLTRYEYCRNAPSLRFVFSDTVTGGLYVTWPGTGNILHTALIRTEYPAVIETWEETKYNINTYFSTTDVTFYNSDYVVWTGTNKSVNISPAKRYIATSWN